MKNIGKLVGQVQQMQEQMKLTQERLEMMEIEGQSGGGLIKIRMNGQGQTLSLSIDPSLIKSDEQDILEDLLVAAYNDAKLKIDQMTAEEMGKLTGGLSLPAGLSLPF